MGERGLLVPLVWLLAMLLCAWQVARTPVATDLALFVPQDGPAARLLNEVRAGPAARLILIGLEGGSEEARAEVSQGLAARLRDTDLFVRVSNGMEGLDRKEQRRLFSYRYLLSPQVSEERFGAVALRAALEQRLRALASPFSTVEKRLLPADPTAEFLGLLEAWRAQSEPDKRHGVWFSADGRLSLLLAETQASGFDPDVQKTVITAIERAFAAAEEGAGLKLLLSGAAVFAVVSSDTIRAEVQALGIAASAVVVLLLLASYRSPRIVLLSALPLGAGILAAVAVVGLLFGKIYGITLGFGMTLLGVAGDYPIHVFSHLHGSEPVRQSLARIWPTLRLGVATTALGYVAMLSTEFTGLAQLGMFAIVGLLTAAACTRWLLPALLPPVWVERRQLGGVTWLRPLLSPGRPVAIAALIFGLAMSSFLVGAAPLRWEDDLAALSPVPEQALALDRELRTALGAPEAGHMIVVRAADAETALQRAEDAAGRLVTLVEAGVLSGYESPTRYLPSQRTQRQRQAVLPGRDALAGHLNAALQGLPFRPGVFEPFLQAVEQARTASPLTPQDLTGTALGLRVSSLLLQSDSGWLALLPLSGVRDPAALAAAFPGVGAEDPFYVNLKAETEHLLADFRGAALVRMSLGFAAITLVLWLGLRSLRQVLSVLLPVLLAVVVDLAVLSWLGERLSLFHLVSLLLVVGINLDYGLFFGRSEPNPDDQVRTLHAMLLCCGSTLAVFGMLALSALPVLKAIGQTVSIGVLASFCMTWALTRRVAG